VVDFICHSPEGNRDDVSDTLRGERHLHLLSERAFGAVQVRISVLNGEITL